MKRPVSEHLATLVVKQTEYIQSLPKGTKEYAIAVKQLVELNKAYSEALKSEASVQDLEEKRAETERKNRAEQELEDLKFQESQWQATVKNDLERKKADEEASQFQEKMELEYAKLEHESKESKLERYDRLKAREEEAEFKKAQLKQQHDEFMLSTALNMSMDLLDRGLEREYYQRTIGFEERGVWTSEVGRDQRRGISFLKHFKRK